MTKYILAGGNDLGIDGYGSDLAREIYETVERPANILSCFFATPSELWDVKEKVWREWFERYFGTDMLWSYAVPETFIQQMNNADIVYLHGGDNGLMFEMLDRYPKLSTYFSDKVIVGSSAGANYLSRHYWARRKQQILRGRDIVPYSVIVHYESREGGVPETDWGSAVRLLRDIQEEPIKLKEGQFQVIEQ